MSVGRQDLNLDIVTVFRRVASEHATRIAVSWTRDLTYRELDQASERLASSLLSQQGRGPEPIPFLLEPGVRPIICLLGILKAGKSYVALNPKAPIAYQKRLLEQLDAQLLLVERPSELGVDTLDIRNCQLLESPTPQPLGSDLAATIFTSGSTGTPKSFHRTHKAILHRAYLYQSEQRLAPGDRQALTAACHFVASETDIFGTLLSGATLCPYPLPQLNIAHFKDWLESEGITLLHPPVGFFRRFLNSLKPQPHFPELRLVALGGEPLYRSDVLLWRERFFADCKLCHRYSSSEAGNIASLTLDINSELPWEKVPTGLPCQDKDVRIEDEDGANVGPGCVGEIVVTSDFLSSGFQGSCHTGDLGALDKSGMLHHHGRRDRLAKVRGHRVDLGAVEAALLACDSVLEAKVQVEQDQLVAYTVGQTTSGLRESLLSKLPPEAVPNRFHLQDSLTLNENGKVAAQSHSYESELEQQLCAIWTKVLNNQVGPNDNFFRFGGTSLDAAQIIFEAEPLTRQELHASLLSRFPTPRLLAQYFNRSESSKNLVPLREDGTAPPLFLVHPNSGQILAFNRLTERLAPQLPVYAFRALGLQQGEQPHQDIFSMASGYVRQLREVQPKGPYRLAGRCFGAVAALEMARLLQEEGETVEKLIIFDAAPPKLRTSTLRAATARANEVLLWLNQNARHPVHILKRVTHRLSSKKRWSKPGPKLNRPEEVFTHLGHLLFMHESSPYQGDVIFLCGDEPITQGWLRGWKKIVKGEIAVIDVPGNHGEILKEPFVREVAERLNAHF